MFSQTTFRAVREALKLIYKQIENFNFKSRYYSGFKTFWSVQNEQYNINTINNLMPRNKATTRWFLYSIYKYSTSQTEISVGEFINFCINDGNKEFIDITKCGDF